MKGRQAKIPMMSSADFYRSSSQALPKRIIQLMVKYARSYIARGLDGHCDQSYTPGDRLSRITIETRIALAV
jgi:hypothetical protein